MSDQRFEAAKAAMQGTLANHMRNGRPSEYANEAVQYADALLAELDKTKPKSTTTDSEQMLSVMMRLHHGQCGSKKQQELHSVRQNQIIPIIYFFLP